MGMFSGLNKNNLVLLLGLFIVLCINETFVGYVTAYTAYSLLVFFLIPANRYKDNSYYWLAAFVLLFSVIGYFTDFIPNLSFFCKNLFPPLAFYLIGAYFCDLNIDNKKMLTFLLFLIIGYSLIIYLSTLYSIIANGAVIEGTRVLSILGMGDKSLSATLIGLTMSIGMCGLPAFLIIDKEYGIIKYLFLAVFIASTITTLHLINRTALVIAVINLVVIIVLFAKNHKKIIWMGGLVVVMFIWVSSMTSSFDVVESAYMDRGAIEDNASTLGQRTERWIMALSYLFNRPFGWWQNEPFRAHNMWLDIARVTGLIPFFISIVFSFKSLGSAVNIVKIRKNEVTAVIVSIYICFTISCFMEPVYAGTHWYMYCLFVGLINRYCRILKSNCQ